MERSKFNGSILRKEEIQFDDILENNSFTNELNVFQVKSLFTFKITDQNLIVLWCKVWLKHSFSPHSLFLSESLQLVITHKGAHNVPRAFLVRCPPGEFGPLNTVSSLSLCLSVWHVIVFLENRTLDFSDFLHEC